MKKEEYDRRQADRESREYWVDYDGWKCYVDVDGSWIRPCGAVLEKQSQKETGERIRLSL